MDSQDIRRITSYAVVVFPANHLVSMLIFFRMGNCCKIFLIAHSTDHLSSRVFAEVSRSAVCTFALITFRCAFQSCFLYHTIHSDLYERLLIFYLQHSLICFFCNIQLAQLDLVRLFQDFFGAATPVRSPRQSQQEILRLFYKGRRLKLVKRL